MQEPILERFKNAIDFLLETKIATKKKEIALSCGVTPNYLSGVLYERISLSGDLVQKFLSQWPINPAYMACQSDEIDLAKVRETQDIHPAITNETTNVTLIRLINRLKSENMSKEDRQLAGDELSELFARLMDENIGLRNDLMESYKVIKKIKH